jgi:bifunctional pyridoxal-dependent enzyme with beta-cystathionase and maltose regulon repressor activities
MPNLQNPTAAVMGVARREAIVEIARRHGVILVEDDVYGFLLGDQAPPPLAALAPEITYHLSSLSKSVARTENPHAVRVCLGAPRSREAVAKGLGVLAETLRAPAAPLRAVV